MLFAAELIGSTFCSDWALSGSWDGLDSSAIDPKFKAFLTQEKWAVNEGE